MQAVRLTQEALPVMAFLGQLRLFSRLRRDSALGLGPAFFRTKPQKWWDTGSGRSGYRQAFEVGAWHCELELSGGLASALPPLAALVEQEVRRIEAKFSQYGDASVIQALNQNAGRSAVAVDAETEQLLDLTHDQWLASEGWVDATSGVVRYAWDAGQFNAPHDARELQHLLSCIGWQYVRRLPGWVRFDHPALEINLESLHEAFAVDRAVALVQAAQGVSGCLRIGHARRVVGTLPSPSNRPASALQTGSLDTLMASWPQRQGGLVAKGFAFDVRQGDAVSQLGFDPKTGQPLLTWQQLVVQAPTAIQADTWVKIALAKGKDAVEWLNQQQVSYYALRRDGQLFCSQLEASMLAAPQAGVAA